MARQRLKFIAASLLILSGKAGAAQNHSDQEAVKQVELASSVAYSRNDAKALSRTLAADFIGHWADGSTTTKREEVEMLRKGGETYEANRIEGLSVRVFGSTAIATGRTVETSLIAGKNATGVYNFTDVLMRRNGRWQVVASQSARSIPYGSNCTTVTR